MSVKRIAITAGEPAGIGPELLVQLAQQPQREQLIAIADPALLQQRATQLGLPLTIKHWQANQTATANAAGELWVKPHTLASHCQAGELNPANADYVLQTLQDAADGCLNREYDAVVTAPVHKGVINQAGHSFSGHTEFFADCAKVKQVVMMLTSDELRVALVTTHLPLHAVPQAISKARLQQVLEILRHDLQHHFAIAEPRICVLGLNPHAGESGHMGREEIDTIEPVLAELRQRGWQLQGPLPADTAFTPKHLQQCDVVLAMYHDQGLPVLKYQGFGRAVNITLGLPFIRTSVDHGTALDLAGTGRADPGSLQAALQQAIAMVQARDKLHA